MKLAVISQQALEPSHKKIGDLQYEYCLKKFLQKNIPVFRHIGSKDLEGNYVNNLKKKFVDNYYYYDPLTSLLHLDCDDYMNPKTGYDPRGYKTYYAFKYLIENVDFDILFKTGNTSYLDVDGILETVKTFKTERLYTGAISGWPPDFVEGYSGALWFIVGAFTFISRDLVEHIVNNKERYLTITTEASYIKNAFVLEDVCIGRIFKELNLNITPDSQPNLTRPPVIHKNTSPIGKIEKCKDCLTYRVEKDYIKGYKKLHTFYS